MNKVVLIFAIGLAGCSSAAPAAPIDPVIARINALTNCHELYLEGTKFNGAFEWFTESQGANSAPATSAFNHLVATNDRMQALGCE